MAGFYCFPHLSDEKWEKWKANVCPETCFTARHNYLSLDLYVTPFTNMVNFNPRMDK